MIILYNIYKSIFGQKLSNQYHPHTLGIFVASLLDKALYGNYRRKWEVIIVCKTNTFNLYCHCHCKGELWVLFNSVKYRFYVIVGQIFSIT